jgi:hypothetical protein
VESHISRKTSEIWATQGFAWQLEFLIEAFYPSLQSSAFAEPVSEPLVRARWSKGSPLASLCIMRAGWRCPQIRADAIQVVHNLSIFNREFTE